MLYAHLLELNNWYTIESNKALYNMRLARSWNSSGTKVIILFVCIYYICDLDPLSFITSAYT